MKKTTILSALAVVSTLSFACAQEQVSREDTMKYACLVSFDLKQLMGTPIPTDVDLKRAIAIRDGEFGGMVLPEAKLTAAQIAGAKEEIVPVGQLWMYNLAPMRNGSAISSDSLRLAKVSNDGNEVKLPQCALGARRNSSGALELVVFGKSKEPLLAVPLKALDDQQPQAGIQIKAERESDSGKVILTIAGKYEATIQVTQLEQ